MQKHNKKYKQSKKGAKKLERELNAFLRRII